MIEGFFSDKDGQSKYRPNGKKRSCVVCGLYKTAVSPRMPPVGNFKKKILIVGASPTEKDDKLRSHWQSDEGYYLKRTLKTLGIDLFEDCLSINSCHCRTIDKYGHDRDPTSTEVECCRRTTFDYVEIYKPKLAILLGDSAIYSLIGNRWRKDFGTLNKWRGWQIPDLNLNTWICPTFHPSYVMECKSRKNSGAEETIWIQDLQKAISTLKNPLYIYKEPEIEIIEDLNILYEIKSGDVAIDYETTGLKPHAKGHKIICAAVATSEDHAYAFMMPETRKEQRPFLYLLANPNVGKIAQNMKFEDTWSWIILRQRVINWVWDTMLMTHTLDNRRGITGLKFQTYVNFGVIDYDSEIAPYLRSKTEESANDINQIDQLLNTPKNRFKLLKYCGLDTIYEYRLSVKQRIDELPF